MSKTPREHYDDIIQYLSYLVELELDPVPINGIRWANIRWNAGHLRDLYVYQDAETFESVERSFAYNLPFLEEGLPAGAQSFEGYQLYKKLVLLL